jgi:demethylmenaquinone methyltransferase/2-methoxy-6-polyprenyl-1,4-benzoquinol methylase
LAKADSVVTPYQDDREKKVQVESMFDNIAPKYDRLNQILSLGIHRSWRKKAVDELVKLNPKSILDLATGTGDFAIASLRANPDKINGADISEGMMEFGRKKVSNLGIDKKISFIKADAENLPFQTSSFDAITIAFGVRNFQNLDSGLREMFRVLKPEGKVIILEFSKPEGWFKPFYGLYFRFVLPVVGRIISKDTSAYSYLPASVNAFPHGEKFLQHLRACGYEEVTQTRLTFGVASIYMGKKIFKSY